LQRFDRRHRFMQEVKSLRSNLGVQGDDARQIAARMIEAGYQAKLDWIVSHPKYVVCVAALAANAEGAAAATIAAGPRRIRSAVIAGSRSRYSTVTSRPSETPTCAKPWRNASTVSWSGAPP
jgi:hypothetical protein